MNGWDIAVIVIVSISALAAIGGIIYRKVKHKSSGCGCCGCENCPSCNKRKKDE